jgi:predicted nuclease of predicted toxin-antitoxin system
MSVKFYFDVHVRRAVAEGLRLRRVDVLTAQEDGAAEFKDPKLLDRAHTLGRVLFTQDRDFLKEASRRQQLNKSFSGVIYAHQLNVSISQCVAELELIGVATDVNEWTNKVVYLPLA